MPSASWPPHPLAREDGAVARGLEISLGGTHRAGDLPLGCGQPRGWAALDPNGAGSSPVAWGATEEEARQRAVEACRNSVKDVCQRTRVHATSTRYLPLSAAHSRAVAVPQRLRPTAARRRRMCGRCLPALGIRIARSSTISRQQPARGSRRTRGYPRRPAKKASLRCQLKVRWAACP
jgi:hypothetical protein